MHHEGCFEDGNLLIARSKGRAEKAANGIYVQVMADYTNARKKVAQGEMEAFLPTSSGTAKPKDTNGACLRPIVGHKEASRLG